MFYLEDDTDEVDVGKFREFIIRGGTRHTIKGVPRPLKHHHETLKDKIHFPFHLFNDKTEPRTYGALLIDVCVESIYGKARLPEIISNTMDYIRETTDFVKVPVPDLTPVSRKGFVCHFTKCGRACVVVQTVKRRIKHLGQMWHVKTQINLEHGNYTTDLVSDYLEQMRSTVRCVLNSLQTPTSCDGVASMIHKVRGQYNQYKVFHIDLDAPDEISELRLC